MRRASGVASKCAASCSHVSPLVRRRSRATSSRSTRSRNSFAASSTLGSGSNAGRLLFNDPLPEEQYTTHVDAVADAAGNQVDSGSATFDVDNTPPEAYDSEESGDQDEDIEGTLEATDDDMDELTFSKVSDPGHGTVTIDAEGGTFTYDPDPDFVGMDSFQFKVNDGADDSLPARVTLHVGDTTGLPEVAVTLESTIVGRLSGNPHTYDGSLEGDDLVFAVTIALPQGVTELAQQITVSYATRDGSATADSDYTATTGTLTFAAGASGAALKQTITVTTGDDRDVEPNETMYLDVTSVEGAVLVGGTVFTGDGSAEGWIRNNDVDIVLFDLETDEPAPGGFVSYDLLISADGADTAYENGLDVQLKGNTTDGTAKADAGDYTARIDHEFMVMSDPVTVKIEIRGDGVQEPDEFFSFSVELGDDTSTEAQVDLEDPFAHITIKD